MTEDEMPVFDQWHWFWKVGDDDTRYWSSEVGAYVAAADLRKTTNVPDEAQLRAVSAHLNLPAP